MSTTDYRAALEFVHVAAETDGPDPFPENVLAQLRQVIPCNTVSYGEFDPGRGGYPAASRWTGDPAGMWTGPLLEAFHALRDQYPHAPSHSAAILRWSDELSRRALRRLELYWEVAHPLGCEHVLTVWLRQGKTVFGGLAFDRFRGDFRERDLDVLELLLPHLVRVARRAAEHWPAAAASLTPREREILAWVARGKTNPQIAGVLHLAPGTVRKHLDNIYDKLDVPNRAAAVTRGYRPPAQTVEGVEGRLSASGQTRTRPRRQRRAADLTAARREYCAFPLPLQACCYLKGEDRWACSTRDKRPSSPAATGA
jgi:DNA-binding CsgD family transcriptional regulator